MRLHREGIARNPGIGGGQLQKAHRIGAQRQAGIAFGQRGRHAEIACRLDHRLAPHLAIKAHGSDIAGLREGFAQQQAFGIAAQRVFGAIAALHDLGVVDAVVRIPAVLKRGEIDEQLEGRSGLALRLRGPVEGRFGVIGAPDHRHHFAIGPHRHQRHLCAAQRSPARHLPGDVLQPAVERSGQGLPLVTAFRQLARLRQGPIGEIGAGRQVALGPDVERGRTNARRLGLGQIARRHHRADHRLHPPFGPLVMLDRIVTRGRLHQAGQHRRLTVGQVFGPAIEEMEARRAQAIDVVAEIGVRQIAFENLVLGEPAFQPEGDQHLARLAGQRLFGRQEGEFGELLGDGRSAAISGPGGTRDAARIDSPMRIEAPVLNGQKRLDHMRRQCGDLDRLVHDRAVARYRRSVGGQKRNLRRRDRFERFVERRGYRQPGDQQNEYADRGRNNANRPPAFAPVAPVSGAPPRKTSPLLALDRLVDMAEPGIPVVIGWRARIETEGREPLVVIVVGIGAQPVMQREIAAMRSRFRIVVTLAPERIEQAHRLLC